MRVANAWRERRRKCNHGADGEKSAEAHDTTEVPPNTPPSVPDTADFAPIVEDGILIRLPETRSFSSKIGHAFQHPVSRGDG